MKKIVIGNFQSLKNFWFIIPKNRKEFSSDFFVSEKNTFWAKNWDLVEAEIIWKSRWKNEEAKILKIISYESEEKIVWIYSQSRDNFFGFIDVEGQDKWYFVHGKNRLSANSWDKVEAILKKFNWKIEAEIIKILERKKWLIIWIFKKSKWNFWFVIPRDKNIKNDIFVAMTNSSWANSWDIVWVEIIKETWKNPEWIVKEIIARKWTLDKREEDILILAMEWWARIKFNEKISTELEKISEKIEKEEFEKRVDLREKFTFTIDWKDAKDLDDAISIEKKENWDFILYVSIADVSHYVKENSELDKEALARVTSIYLADRVIPMLPEKLSNNLCSLNPHTEKLTLTCEMHIWGKTWHTVESKVYESVIKSDFRLTYEEIDKILDFEIKIWEKLAFWWILTEELFEKIKISDDLKKNILKFREKNGTLNFDFPETYVSFDENWEPNWVKEYPRFESNKMIEVFMVSANEAVAKNFSKNPFLYRIHEEPKPFDIAELEEKLKIFDISFKFKNVTTLEFAELLEKFKNLEDTKRIFLEKITLRTLTQAVYSSLNLGHFWLWLQYYSHFTSPIRRYPDLQIHRIIKEILHKKFDNNRKNHYLEILWNVAEYSSEKEKMAEKLEYRVRDYFIVKYYKNKIWEEFEAIISWVISKWVFVSLPDTAEGFVEFKNSIFDEKMQSHKIHWQKYVLGQNIKVKLVEADEELLRLNFEIIL